MCRVFQSDYAREMIELSKFVNFAEIAILWHNCMDDYNSSIGKIETVCTNYEMV